MPERSPTRIELHKLKYHWLGRKTGMIEFHRLDDEEKKIVANDILHKIYESGGEDPYGVYAEVLAQWGIVCPHPQHMRSYGGTKKSEFPLTSFRWYNCEVCKCTTMNEDYEVTKKVG